MKRPTSTMKLLSGWLSRENLTNAEAAGKLRVPLATFEQWLYGRHKPNASGLAIINVVVKK